MTIKQTLNELDKINDAFKKHCKKESCLQCVFRDNNRCYSALLIDCMLDLESISNKRIGDIKSEK